MYHQFIPSYPEQFDSDIQYQIARRKEFNILAQTDEPEQLSWSVKKFLKRQDLVQRYISIYNKCIIIDEPGTGKSGIIVDTVDHGISDDPNFKKAYVFEPGPPTKDQFYNQVLKLSNISFESGIYTENEISRKIQINRKIKQYYSIETYKTFISELEKRNLSDSQIIEEFSDCYFFLDEAHRLRNQEQGDTILSQEDQVNIYNWLWRIFHLAKRITIIVISATPMINKVDDFVPLFNLILEKDRQLPTSWDYKKVNIRQLEPYFRGLIGYIRGSDLGVKRVEIGETINYTHKIEYTKDKTPIIPTKKEIINGNITTIREDMIQPDSEIFTEEIKSSTVVYKLEMKDTQRDSYIKCEKNKNFRTDERQISVAVFPDGSYSDEGFKKYIKEEDGIYSFTKTFFDEFPISIKKKDGSRVKRKKSDMLLQLRGLSCKYADFIEREIINFENKENEDPKVPKTRGCSAIYLESVRNTGLIYFGLLLELFGYEMFDRPSIFRKVRKEDGTYQEVITDYPKKKRFALITSVNSNNIESILKLMSSKENIDGEYIQILAYSKLARDGINIFNIRSIYLAGSDWHESGMLQALSRVFRADSYLNLLSKYENILIEIYKYAAILESSVISRILSKKQSGEYKVNETYKEGEVIDLDMYLTAEKKDIYEAKKFHIMKVVAFDGMLNYIRNVNENDKNYSKETDYETKFYRLWSARGDPGNTDRIGLAMNQGPNDTEEITKTYELFYYYIAMKTFARLVLYYLSEKGEDTIENIITYFNSTYGYDISYKLVYSTLEYIKEKKWYLFNREGEKRYITRVGSSVYITDKYFEKTIKYLPSKSYSYFSREISLESSSNKNKEDLEIVPQIIYNLLDLSYEEIFDFLSGRKNEVKLTNLQRREILEKSVVKFIETKSEKYLKIINCFDIYLYRTDEPDIFIKYTKGKLNNVKIGMKGKPREENSIAGLKNIFNDYQELLESNPDMLTNYDYDTFITKDLDEEKPSLVWYHFFDSNEEKDSYTVNSIFTRKDKPIRVLFENSSNLKFRDVKREENTVFNFLVSFSYEDKMEKFTQDKIYGTIIYGRDGNFRIGGYDKKIKGLTCNSIQYEELRKIYVDFCVENLDNSELEEIENKLKEDRQFIHSKDLKKKLLENGISQNYIDICTYQKLYLNLNWLLLTSKDKMNKDDICGYLRKLFLKYKRVLEII